MEKLLAFEKELSGILFERSVDSKGFANICSKGDTALFGGNTTKQMKTKLGVPEDLPAEEDIKKVQRRLKSEGKKLSTTRKGKQKGV